MVTTLLFLDPKAQHIRRTLILMALVERRKHIRYSCDLAVEVRPAETSPDSHDNGSRDNGSPDNDLRDKGLPEEARTVSYPGKLADICLGGCFVSTVSPLPAGTAVTVLFHAPDFAQQRSSSANGNGAATQGSAGQNSLAPDATAIVASIVGRTVTSVPGNGMGIEFTAADSESSARLKALIHRLENSAAWSATDDARPTL